MLTEKPCLERKTKENKKLKLGLPYDPSVPLDRDLKEAPSAHHTETCTAIFMATLFTMTRMWNQPGYP